MKITVFVASLSTILVSATFAQKPKPSGTPATTPATPATPTAPPAPAAPAPPEKAMVIASDRAYEAAYAKADVKALADFFTEDAEYTSDDGRTFSGRAAIQESIQAAFRANKGSKLAINLESVRVLSPDVLVEKGSTTVTATTGNTSSSQYTAIQVKKEGKWKISQLIETPTPVLTPREQLAELEWLVGRWAEADKTTNLDVDSQYSWARGGNFLTRNVTVKRSGEVTLEGWQIIGWDPLAERIRSWTFDGEGGYSEGQWTREGNRWLVRESGYTPDGDRTTAENTITKVAADRLTFESNSRTLDGEPQPGIGRIEINRVKGN
jgi:uncharacterized protein (TIGR02246 family)